MIDGLPRRLSINCSAFCFNENEELLLCCFCISVIRITSDRDVYAISDVYMRLTEREIGQS
jgi:hypothetical protein